MGIGTGIVLIAAGAILRWAVTFTVPGIDLQILGIILMAAGVMTLAFSLVFWSSRRSHTYRDDCPGGRCGP